MKLPSQSPVQRSTAACGRRGVALVITLIMLAIITFMAVTFLVLSQRERSSVSGATDQKIARNGADTATARACAELLTHMLLQTNFQDYGLLVSTNYINYSGLLNGNPGLYNPTNVNYDYLLGGSTNFNSQDRNENIANLLYNPRPPVYVITNIGTGQAEFRFYLDENRNGRFDTNGTWPVVVYNNNALSYVTTNGAGAVAYITPGTSPAVGYSIVSNTFVGDPEWIGVLERPTDLHSPDNRFISRYAYMVMPIGQSLDINYIHNRAKRISNTGEGFLRNQGVGTWEINLAAFLADLNTNVWWSNGIVQYIYRTNAAPQPVASLGLAFSDANDILNYRYNNDYHTLYPATVGLPGSGNAATLNAALAPANIDYFSDGPLMLGTSNDVTSPSTEVTLPWSGSDNTNHFFSAQDIFSQMPPAFRTRLSNIGTNADSYDEYTFYRMYAQLGVGSAPDRGKLNINYRNIDTNGNIVAGLETNLVPWNQLEFFTNAAAAMFQQMNLHDFNGNLVSITNIPIYEDPTIYGPTNRNYYTPAVHRILQVAANIYDATTTKYFGNGPTNYPSVYRPIFRSQDHIVSIIGYAKVTGTTEAFFPYLNAQDFANVPQPVNAGVNIYGVPWIIGVKKGFPNFNEFSMDNPLSISRKLQFTNALAKGPPWQTNQVLDFAITNSFGVEAWNSYTNAYARPLRLVVSNELSITLTNENGTELLVGVTNLPYGNDIQFTGWPGWTQQKTDNSFIIPLLYKDLLFTNAIYKVTSPQVVPLNPPLWSAAFVPHVWMGLHFKLRFILIDTMANRVLDFVNLESTQPAVDVASILHGTSTGAHNNQAAINNLDEQWDTNLWNGVPDGVLNQIFASEGSYPAMTPPDWIDSPPGSVKSQQDGFRNAIMNGSTNYVQAPYTPHQTIYQRISLQANDPLVHYTLADLTSTNGYQINENVITKHPTTGSLDNLTNLNYAYQPWGGRHLPNGSSLNPNPPFDTDTRVKDPGVQQSDNWDFPTNHLPNVGWLGRVHRGTPWQTIDMKPSAISVQDWIKWDNDNVFITNANSIIIDAPLTHPTMDYGLFDLFTTAINENASHGKLNVNQTNLASWSAVLSGVLVLSNTPTGLLIPTNIYPAGVYDPANPTPVAAIVQGINATRANTNSANGTLQIFPNHQFQHAGDVLATPQLSVQSPFLNTNALATPQAGGINDEIMERIPQQIMSLLTLNENPRFVIYSFGQTLHPADHSLVIGGNFNGLCTNYQITAESATRAVVRVEGTSDPQYSQKPDPWGRTYPPHLVVEEFNVLGPD